MNIRVILFGVVVFIVCSCHKEISNKELGTYRSKLNAAYHTDDFRAAENVFFSDLRTLSNWQSSHIKGIDFPFCRALDHEGLFYLYRKAEMTNQMIAQFQLSITCLNESRSSFGLPPMPIVTMDEFAKAIEKREGVTMK